MADEIDLNALQNGDPDLAQRDFRDADISNLSLTGRDFSGAHLERANATGTDFSDSIFEKVHLAQFVAENANLSRAKFSTVAFTRVNLRGSDLRDVEFGGSHFSQTDFTRADIRGANFSKCHLNDGTTFANCIVNEETNFEGAVILRSLSREPAFANYKFERGKLVRLNLDNIAAHDSQPSGVIGLRTYEGLNDRPETLVKIPDIPSSEQDGIMHLDKSPQPATVKIKDPAGIPAKLINAEISASRENLAALVETLKGLRGRDSRADAETDNRQISPFAEEDLLLLISLVSAAIELEKSPVITQEMGSFLETVLRQLQQAQQILKAMNKGAGNYLPLITALGIAISSLGVFLGMLV
ncbi:MAG: pentapeptide repeat-containing protein [Parvibaculum sp.]